LTPQEEACDAPDHLTWGLRESLKPSYFEAFLALTALFLDVGVLGYTFKQVLNMTNLFEL
jgi:hypothetical protein